MSRTSPSAPASARAANLRGGRLNLRFQFPLIPMLNAPVAVKHPREAFELPAKERDAAEIHTGESLTHAEARRPRRREKDAFGGARRSSCVPRLRASA